MIKLLILCTSCLVVVKNDLVHTQPWISHRYQVGPVRVIAHRWIQSADPYVLGKAAGWDTASEYPHQDSDGLHLGLENGYSGSGRLYPRFEKPFGLLNIGSGRIVSDPTVSFISPYSGLEKSDPDFAVPSPTFYPGIRELSPDFAAPSSPFYPGPGGQFSGVAVPSATGRLHPDYESSPFYPGPGDESPGPVFRLLYPHSKRSSPCLASQFSMSYRAPGGSFSQPELTIDKAFADVARSSSSPYSTFGRKNSGVRNSFSGQFSSGQENSYPAPGADSFQYQIPGSSLSFPKI